MEAGQLPRRPSACRTPRAQDLAPRVLSSTSLHVESKSVQSWVKAFSPPPPARLPHGPASFYSRSRWLGLTATKAKSGSPWPPSFHSRALARAEVRAGRRRPSPSSRSPGPPAAFPVAPRLQGTEPQPGQRGLRGKESGALGAAPERSGKNLPRAPSRSHPRDLPGEESRRCASRRLPTFFPSHPHNVCKWPLSLFCKWGVCAHKTYCRRRPALRGRRSDSAATRSEPAEAGPCAPSPGMPLRGRCWAPGAARTEPQTR